MRARSGGRAKLAEHAGRTNHVADAEALTRAAETVAACPFVARAQGIAVGLALATAKRRSGSSARGSRSGCVGCGSWRGVGDAAGRGVAA